MAASIPSDATSASSLGLLEAYLREHFPRDVLIPCIKGEKRPSRKFSGGQWTWFDYDRLSQASLENHDWAITLHDLCVVDVDSVEQASALEARFPVLLTAPAAKTRKGMHYFFRRSPLADEKGYLDGAAQREKGIDFKTVCSTGTGGILVVCPSPNKVWVRPPFGEAATVMTAIPDDLLDAVAVATDRRVPNAASARKSALALPTFNPAAANARFAAFLAEFLCDPDGLLSVRFASALASANAGIAGGSIVSCITSQNFPGTDLDLWVRDSDFDALCAEMPSLFLTEKPREKNERTEALLKEYGQTFPRALTDANEHLIRLKDFHTRPTPSAPFGNKIQIIATGAGGSDAVGADFMEKVVSFFDLSCVRVYAVPVRGASPCLFSIGGAGLEDCRFLSSSFLPARLNVAIERPLGGFFFFRTLMRSIKYASRGFSVDFSSWLYSWTLWWKIHESRVNAGEIVLSRAPLLQRFASILETSGIKPRAPESDPRLPICDARLQNFVAALSIACACADGLPFAPSIAEAVAKAAARVPERAALLGGAKNKVPRPAPRAPHASKLAAADGGASAEARVAPVTVRSDLAPPPTGSFPEGTVFSNAAYMVANVVGTRNDQLKFHTAKAPPFACVDGGSHGGWLGFIFSKTGACEHACQHDGCEKPARVGAHVYVRGWGTRYTFLLASCQDHNIADHARVSDPREKEYNPTLCAVKHLAVGAHFDRFAREDASWMKIKDGAKLVLMKAVDLASEESIMTYNAYARIVGAPAPAALVRSNTA
jgi:hypothetical protein